MAELTRSIKIPEALYRRVMERAATDRRTLTVTLELMIDGPASQEQIDHWLDMTTKREVNARWDRVTNGRPKEVRVDGR